MEIICSHDACTGCQACRLVCPQQCIKMEENERGFIYPVVDQISCINCKKCQKVCPSLNPPQFSEKPVNVYAGWAKDNKARKYSTSGAISYVFAKYFLEKGDAFCGVIWTKDGAVHKISKDINDIKLFQGSKYSHSDVNDTYEAIKRLLDTNQNVLFSGTPCQVAALKKYLNKEYLNLFTIDIVCHGVPSRKILFDRIAFIEQSNNKSVVELRFRDKQPDQLHTCCKYIFEDGTYVLHEYNKDFFFRSFVDNFALRENCFNCQYSRINRVSDITLADFWGYYPKSLKFRDFEKGVSLIMINNLHGQQLFERVSSNIVFEKRPIEDCSNRNLYEPQAKPSNYEDYWNDYEDRSVSRAKIQDAYLSKPEPVRKSYLERVRSYVFMTLPKPIVKLISQLKRLIK